MQRASELRELAVAYITQDPCCSWEVLRDCHFIHVFFPLNVSSLRSSLEYPGLSPISLFLEETAQEILYIRAIFLHSCTEKENIKNLFQTSPPNPNIFLTFIYLTSWLYSDTQSSILIKHNLLFASSWSSKTHA